MRYLETLTDVPIDDLDEFPGNAKQHDIDDLRESVRENGQFRAVLARRLDGRLQLLAGHGTREAFRQEGATHLRVEVLDADDPEALRVVLRDNPKPGSVRYDQTALLRLLDQTYEGAGSLKGSGWTDVDHSDLASLLTRPPDVEGLAAKHGDDGHDASAFDPEIKMRVPSAMFERWRAALDHHDGDDDIEKLAALLDEIEQGR